MKLDAEYVPDLEELLTFCQNQQDAFHKAMIPLIERAIPKKPTGRSLNERCPICDNDVWDAYCCPFCGQKIEWPDDWEREEE